MIGLHVNAKDPRGLATKHEGSCAQVFLGSPRMWKMNMPDRDCDGFPTWSHASYLINLAGTDPDKWERSRVRMLQEVEAAARYGARGVVVHPGSGDPEGWLRFMEEGPFPVPILLENSAGRGVAQTPEQLQALALATGLPVCIDTCHAFAAGREPVDFIYELGDGITVDLIHANGARHPFGSGRDGHAEVDQAGQLPGIVAAISHAGCPAVCETPTPRSVGILLRAMGNNRHTAQDLVV